MKNAMGYDEEAIAACNIFVEDIHQNLKLMYGKTNSDKELGEKNIKIALRTLVGLMLNRRAISVEVHPEKNLWDFQVTFVFTASVPDLWSTSSFVRSTRCVDPTRGFQIAAMDLCMDTVSCCVFARRKYEEDFITGATADDIFYAMHFVSGNLTERCP